MTAPLVVQLAEADGRRLYESLGRGPYAFTTVPHARWSARGEDVTATLYRSGKLVVQGRGVDVFRDRYLPTAASVERPQVGETESLEVPTIGSDESGKGDYFGPLTVAAACVTPEDLEFLGTLGVRDSKAVGNETVRRLEGVLMDRLPHAVRVLMPEAYNAAYAETPNLNRLLGRLHAEVIEETAAKAPKAARVVVDRFGDPSLVRRHLRGAKGLDFAMPTRGERNPAVAAASFLARAAFLRGFQEGSDLSGGTLPRGASDPRILTEARRLVREGGLEWLGRFAKLHFRVTQKARA